MENLDLNAMGVMEMTNDEALITNGGSWLSRAWDNTVNALQSAYDWCIDTLNLDVEIGRVN